jgi:hypothetical protein
MLRTNTIVAVAVSFSLIIGLVVVGVPTQLVSASDTANHEGGRTDQVSADFGWTAEFFNTRTLEGPVVATLRYPTGPLNLDWSFNAPADGVLADGWSARFTRVVNFPSGGQIRFEAKADDTVTVYVDDRVVTASAPYFANIVYDSFITLSPGNHIVEVHYSDIADQAFVFVNWSGGETEIVSPTGVIGTVNAGGGLNFRETPTIATDNQIGVLPFGASYALLGKSENARWAYLDVDGVRGWVSVFWLNLSDSLDNVPVVDETATTPMLEVPGDVSATASPIYNVIIRECPDTSCTQIGLALWQAPVEVFGQSTDGEWIMIRYTAQEGTEVIGWSYKPYYRVGEELSDLVPELPIVQ